jgi:flagellar basal-body rod protein FlgB
MATQGIFSETFSLLSKVLDLRSRKHSVIVSNIANIDTPNYKAFDLMVEAEMNKAERGVQPKLSVSKTHRDHLCERDNGADGVMLTLAEPSPFSLRGDGNTVDIDRSMASLAQNSLMYNAAARIIYKKFQGLKAAIQGGK